MAAMHGAELAESVLSRSPGGSSGDFRVLYASAPTDAAAVRAAGRLAATESIYALAGGFGANQATQIGAIAAANDLLFFNIAAIEDELRGDACRETTFHVEGSESMYSDAAIDWMTADGAERIFVVHVRDANGEALADRAALRAEGAGAEFVGSVGVDPSQFVFVEATSAAMDARADGILLALPPSAQELFLGQMSGAADDVRVTGLPYPLTQTRSFLFRLRDTNATAGVTPRMALWDASLESGRAGELNDEFASRAGAVMEPTGWAAYAYVMIARQTAAETESTSAEDLVTYLEDPETSFDVGKSMPLSFRRWNHQARQPIYVVTLREGAEWSRSVRDRISLGRVVTQIPEAATTDRRDLDRLGRGVEASGCAF